jgi:hypothetical protein
MADTFLEGARARRQRLSQSLANQQAMFLGQQRGSRNIADITRQYTEGYRPVQASFGQRGLGGPNVKSGIRRAGLAKYAETMQRELGRETENMQNELNSIAALEAGQQADLDAYLNELALTRQQQIMADATTLRELQGF